MRFQYAVDTFLIRYCYAGHNAAMVELRFCRVWAQLDGLQGRSYYAATMKDLKLTCLLTVAPLLICDQLIRMLLNKTDLCFLVI